MPIDHFATCTLCEAACGIVVSVEEERVTAIRGDDDDPQSRGFLCPKATALADLHHDPDRLRRPLLREGSTHREIGWDEALTRAGEGLARVRERYGRDALAVYYGNPTAHNFGLLTHGLPLTRLLRTKNLYSASTADQMPQMLASQEMYGHLGLVPVPDVDRTDHFVIVGGNPLVSNGSIMTAPDMKRRLRAIRERGGKVVVIDPRRTETAEVASEHVFVRPGTDAFLLLAMLHVIFDEGRVRTGSVGAFVDGLDRLRAQVRPFSPGAVAPLTGIDAATIARLARELAAAPRAAVYGRVGMCTQEHGTTAAWLVQALNVVTGRLDAEGGVMFTTPAVDLLGVLDALGMGHGYGRWRSRVRGLPEVAGELPIAVLAEEIEHEGPGQPRALLTMAGNPALSAPNGPRLERALPKLEFMVSIDAFLNETTRHADVILPPVSPLSRSHYDLALNVFAVRNQAKYVRPVFPRKADERHDWEILAHVGARLLAPGPVRAAFRMAALAGPEAVLEAGLRVGPYGVRRGREGLSLSALRAQPHGVDLGPLQPRLPGLLATKDRRVRLAPAMFEPEVAHLAAQLGRAPGERGLVLIGRRTLRSNNSWLHNTQRMVKGPVRCTLLMHPDDARALGLAHGARVTVRSRVGQVEVPLEVSDEIMAGVVSLPHGWGHDRPGTRLGVARAHAAASANDLTDETFLDRLSGTAGFSGVRVTVEPAREASAAE
jgi:anaerobic selenocysteine-containing dehydrogenase